MRSLQSFIHSFILSINIYWIFLCNVNTIVDTKIVRFHSREEEIVFRERRFVFIFQLCLSLAGEMLGRSLCLWIRICKRKMVWRMCQKFEWFLNETVFTEVLCKFCNYYYVCCSFYWKYRIACSRYNKNRKTSNS